MVKLWLHVWLLGCFCQKMTHGDRLWLFVFRLNRNNYTRQTDKCQCHNIHVAVYFWIWENKPTGCCCWEPPCFWRTCCYVMSLGWNPLPSGSDAEPWMWRQKQRILNLNRIFNVTQISYKFNLMIEYVWNAEVRVCTMFYFIIYLYFI